MELVIENVSKSYKQNKALSNFTLTMTPGIYALLGPNGSGKSTLMNIITDNLKADGGKIRFDGKDISKMGREYLKLLGYMPQYPGIYPQFSAEEYLYYMAALKGVKDPEKQIDGVLDEPTAGMDPKQRIAIRNYISKISFDKIVIIATHVVSDIEYIARDVVMLKKGVIVDNAPPDELTEKISGKVFRVNTAQKDVTEYQRKFKVTNISKEDSGGVYLRILSDKAPAEDAIAVSPTLEDYYLHVFGESTV